MKCEIIGGSLPAVLCRLEAGESVFCQKGAMIWMDDVFDMETDGAKGFGRLISGESLFRNRYTAARGAGEIAFASSFPGDIMEIDITPGKAVIAQKGSFLASEPGVEYAVHIQDKARKGLFGGEGFIMQRFSGRGKLLIEIDGAAKEYVLAAGQRKIIDTGYLVMMDDTCTMDIEKVHGAKNMMLGGEGLFNTVVTGPGKIVLQTMPVRQLASVLSQFMPTSK